MKGLPPWVTYTVLRLLLFIVPLAILLILQVPWWISVPAAALIALPVSYIFLGRSRHAVAIELDSVSKRRRPARTRDSEAEDAQLDALEKE